MKKVAVIIAGGSGMGADSARALSLNGYNIAILSSTEKSTPVVCWPSRSVVSKKNILFGFMFSSILSRFLYLLK